MATNARTEFIEKQLLRHCYEEEVQPRYCVTTWGGASTKWKEHLPAINHLNSHEVSNSTRCLIKKWTNIILDLEQQQATIVCPIKNNKVSKSSIVVLVSINETGPLGMTITGQNVGGAVEIDKVDPNTPAYHAGVQPGDVPILFQIDESGNLQVKCISYNDFSQMAKGSIRPMEFNVKRRAINNSSEDNNNRDTKQPAAAQSTLTNINGEEISSNTNTNVARSSNALQSRPDNLPFQHENQGLGGVNEGRTSGGSVVRITSFYSHATLLLSHTPCVAQPQPHNDENDWRTIKRLLAKQRSDDAGVPA